MMELHIGQRAVPQVEQTMLLSISQRICLWDEKSELPGFQPVGPTEWYGTEYEFERANQRLATAVIDTVHQVARTYHASPLPILEPGCGIGRVGVPLTVEDSRYRVTSLDWSPRMLERARLAARSRAVNDRITFHHANALTMLSPSGPILPSTHAIVVVCAFLCHFPQEEEWRLVCGQIAHALSNGGTIVVAEPLVERNRAYRDLPEGLKPHGNTRIRTLSAYKGVFDTYGLRCTHTRYVRYCNKEVYTIATFSL